jgi:hypothetical protein
MFSTCAFYLLRGNPLVARAIDSLMQLQATGLYETNPRMQI